MDEEWVDVLGFEGLYQASSLGRIRSLPKTIRRINKNGKETLYKTKELYLKPSLQACNNGKYYRYRVNLRKNGKTHGEFVHKIILSSFKGAAKLGDVCRHLDGNSLNNHIKNLAWGSYYENTQDSIKHGTKTNPPVFIGEKHHKSKISDKIICELRKSNINKNQYKEKSLELGIHVETLRRIMNVSTRKCAAN